MTFPPPCAMLEADKNRRRTDHVEHFWDTIETIGEGYGFSLFGPRHLATLALFVLTAALCAIVLLFRLLDALRAHAQTLFSETFDGILPL